MSLVDKVGFVFRGVNLDVETRQVFADMYFEDEDIDPEIVELVKDVSVKAAKGTAGFYEKLLTMTNDTWKEQVKKFAFKAGCTEGILTAGLLLMVVQYVWTLNDDGRLDDVKAFFKENVEKLKRKKDVSVDDDI